jgi:hypothetical protein
MGFETLAYVGGEMTRMPLVLKAFDPPTHPPTRNKVSLKMNKKGGAPKNVFVSVKERK